ncbi:MAG: alpha/beta hydrolase [Candidatus Woesebacteria bacterium]|jgi:pimeloyl-ACP methyl ester carboxylesterase
MSKKNNNVTLYILHGWIVDPKIESRWQNFIDLLKKAKIKVKFLKLPGLSSQSNKVWTLNNYLSWLKKEIADSKKIILLGHSFGGQLAIRFAATYPEKVDKLILIASSGIRDHSLKAILKRKFFLVLAKTAKFVFKDHAFKKILYILTGERDYYNAPANMKKTMVNILEDEIIADLDKIQAPTLIVWGEHDQATPLKNAYFKKEKIKNSQLKIIKGARHSPMYTHAQTTAKLVIAFLKKNKYE